MYQVRTLPRGRGFGLYCAEKDNQHWYGEEGYRSLTDTLAKEFPTSTEARKFRAVELNDAPVKAKDAINEVAKATHNEEKKNVNLTRVNT